MGEITIIGTAHVSQKSVDEVTAAVDSCEPQIVAVELDRGRLMVLKGEVEPPSVDSVLKGGNFSAILFMISYSFMGTTYHLERTGDQLDVHGQESAGIPVELDLFPTAGTDRNGSAVLQKDAGIRGGRSVVESG